MNIEKWLEIFKDNDALLEGHFLLTSGKHSNKYLQCAKLLQHPNISEIICKELSKEYIDLNIDVIIGPALGAIILSYELARHLHARSIFAEREEGIMKLRRGFKIEKGEKVLIVEDVITTGGSVKEIMNIVEDYGGEIVGVAGIVDRSNGIINLGVPINTILKMNIEAFEPDNCPLCKEVIPLVKPGSRKIN